MRKWGGNRGRDSLPRILCPVNISHEGKDKIKTFSDEWKWKEWIADKSVPQEVPKEFLAEIKDQHFSYFNFFKRQMTVWNKNNIVLCVFLCMKKRSIWKNNTKDWISGINDYKIYTFMKYDFWRVKCKVFQCKCLRRLW